MSDSRFPEQITPDKNLAPLEEQQPQRPRAQPRPVLVDQFPPGRDVARPKGVDERRIRQVVLLQQRWVREVSEQEVDGDEADQNRSAG